MGCQTEIPPKLFMCLKHWRMVPVDCQKQVWQHYVNGQEIRKDPTTAYLAIVQHCIRIVARREGLIN